MKGLMIKDFCLLGNQKKILPVYLLLMVWFTAMHSDGFAFPFLTMMASILTVGTISYDEIELPLPYDLNAPVAEVGDDDYAIFLQDAMEQPDKYQGKTVRLRGKAVSKSKSLKKGYFYFGREVMTCCANDIRFLPLLSEWKDVAGIRNMGWYDITARVDIRNLPEVYDGPGPVLHVEKIAPCAAPEKEVATFY